MCGCLAKMNKALEAHNTRIAMSFQLTETMGLKARYLVGTEKIDKTKREPMPPVSGNFCPFCGEVLEQP